MVSIARLVLVLAPAIMLAGAQGNGAEGLDAMPIEQLMNLRVQTATLKKQSLRDAPASVTIVTAEEIRRYGFRTLSEVLCNVGGFYENSDGPFRFVGVRGFSLLGDYNTRFLVLINGHKLTDRVYGAMYYFGNDFPLDLELVDQVEIVRGPSSAIYGSNGLFATINILTKSPTNAPRARVSTTVGTQSEQKLSASVSLSGRREVKALISVSAIHAGGRTIEFPERIAASLTPGRAEKVGNGTGARLFSMLTWRNWSVTALFGEYRAIATSGWYRSEFGNTGTTDLESRDYVEAVWNRAVGDNREIQWRTYYDQFRFDGVYDYGGGHRDFDGAMGDWVGSQLIYRHETRRFGTLTFGGEADVDLRNIQYNFDISTSKTGPVRRDVFRTSQPRTTSGVFAQQELRLSPAWSVYLGGRLDFSTYDPFVFSPRIAIVHRRGNTSHKLMYGRAFRDASTFERYWEPNPDLNSERLSTIEFVREQTLHKRIRLLTSVFHFRLDGLIAGVPIRPDTLQYRNTAAANSTGFEAEIHGQPSKWLEADGSLSLQRTRGATAVDRLQNSPSRLAQVRASIPIANRRLMLAGAVRFVGSRMDAFGGLVPAATVADLTLNSSRLRSNLELQLGIRNLFDKRYSDPLSTEHVTRTLPAAGRSVFVRFAWRHD